MSKRTDSPQPVARAFLAALDEQRWRDAADLVAPESRDRFRAGVLHWIADHGAAAFDGPTDTNFASPLSLAGVRDGALAAEMDAADLLARFAEGVHPGNVHRLHPSVPATHRELRITRTLLDVRPRGNDRAWARYRTEWWHAGVRNEATAGEHRMELVRTSAGWRVRDADLSGSGRGHILPPAGVTDR